MTEPVWYRSLYGRMAIGALLGLTGLLFAQAALFLWLLGRSDRPLSMRSPQRALRFVAVDLTTALETDPGLDLDGYVREQFGRLAWRVFVVQPDGHVATNRDFTVPAALLSAARTVARDERPSASRRPLEWVGGRLIRLRDDGRVVAVVGIAPGEGPWTPVFREYGPPLGLAAAVLLVAGAAGMALFVLRPARRRIRTLQEAAEALGAGHSATRAPETGGDEVAALARSFNKMAEELEARVRELKASDRLRRQLLADVSHELMTPLTAMRGYLETLALPGAVPDDETRDRYLRVVTEETSRLESIVGDLLDLARLEGGGSVLHREAVPVEWLFARVGERHEVAMRDRGIHLDRQIAPGAERVDGDARRLEQVLQNLAANAMRHTPVGGRIGLSAEPRQGRVAIRVSDTGSGIAAEHLPFVFDRFYKADASRAQGDGLGSGLGLSIVKAIVEGHGGQISVSSEPGAGAVFEIVLDAARA